MGIAPPITGQHTAQAVVSIKPRPFQAHATHLYHVAAQFAGVCKADVVADADKILDIQRATEALAKEDLVRPHLVGEPTISVHIGEVQFTCRTEGEAEHRRHSVDK